MPAVWAGIVLIVAGAYQSPTFNGLDFVGWALVASGIAAAAARAAASRRASR